MKKAVYWIFTVPFLAGFGIILCTFHVLQVLALRFGYRAHNAIVTGMIFFLNLNLLWVGAFIRFKDLRTSKTYGRPAIIVSNHQGMFDIPAIGWILHKYHPKFIAKKSLAYGIPAISYNIRNGGSTYIDRKKPEEALKKINNFNQYLKDTNRSGVIFAEGTRTRDGSMKAFKTKGLDQMLTDIPDAIVIPVALENFWKLERFGLKPVPFGAKLACTVLEEINREGKSNQEIIEDTETAIRNYLGQ